MVYILADLNNAAEAKQALGGPFLYVQIATRGDLLARQPDKVKKMTAIMRRTLQWIALRSPDEIARAMAYPEAETTRTTRTTSMMLAQGKSAFSPNGVFRREEVATTERFYRTVFNADAKSRSFNMRDSIDARYAGWRE